MYHLPTLTAAFFLLASPSLAQTSDSALRGGKATFEGLGDLPGGDVFSSSEKVSDNGSVVVGLSRSVESQFFAEAFRWENGEMEALGDLPGPDIHISAATDVSANGSIVVGVGDSKNGDGNEAFRWENGQMEGLGFLEGGSQSQANGVSADGSVVVGYSVSANDGSFEAFSWEDETMEGLGDLPGGDFFSNAWSISANGSVMVGQSISESGPEAFRWENGIMEGLGDLPGGDFSSNAWSVSADGSVVVGESSSGNGFLEAFRWANGEMEGLGDLPGGDFLSIAWDVSADGSIVVGRSTSENGTEAFIWTEDNGMRSLLEILEEEYDLDLTGWELFSAQGISADGTIIVGTGTNPEGNTEAWRAFLGKPVADEATPEVLADVLSAPSPNPASGTSTFTIAVERGQHVAVEVFDVMGRHVQSVYEGALAASTSETLTLDASALPAGVYVIRATGEDFVKTRRVTVVR